MKTFIDILKESTHSPSCNCPECVKKREKLSGKFPPKLKDAYAIADYIEELSVGFVDREQIEEYFNGTYAILKQVDINSVKEGNAEGNIRVKSREKKYAKLTTEIPPIIVENGIIIDGNHRYRVAKQLGKEKIWIYDIKEI